MPWNIGGQLRQGLQQLGHNSLLTESESPIIDGWNIFTRASLQEVGIFTLRNARSRDCGHLVARRDPKSLLR